MSTNSVKCLPGIVALQGGTSVACGRASEVRSLPLHGRSSQVSQKFVGYQILLFEKEVSGDATVGEFSIAKAVSSELLISLML